MKKFVDIVVEDSKNYIKNDFILKNYHNNIPMTTKQIMLIATGEEVSDTLSDLYNFPFKTIHEDEWSDNKVYVLINDTSYVEVDHVCSERGESTTITVMATPNIVDDIMKRLKSKFQICDKSFIKWVYNSSGHYVRVAMSEGRLPVKEFYPFLGEKSLEEYYDGFMNSSANVLILIGPPGTAKTSFIRGLLNHTKAGATLSYNQDVLSDDGIFADFISSSEKFFIIEDSDTFIKSREDGNNMMAKFLNVADGLIADKSKKLIFTTNLPTINDVDEALIRKGRCHDILEFKALTKNEADKVVNKFSLPQLSSVDKDVYTIAEIFNQTEDDESLKPKNTSFGFGFVK